MPTQQQIYDRLADTDVDPELSWAEHDLPERERTKHVHRLHPYLGKFVPQLVEVFLNRYFEAGDTVLDPLAGSGTTMVECSTFGAHSVGVDISAFNALLCRVKTAAYNPFVVEHDLRDALKRLEDNVDQVGSEPAAPAPGTSAYLRTWFDRRALTELHFYRELLPDYPDSRDLMSVLLSRSARSARMTAHYDLDFPKAPKTGPYQCHKHARICSPTREAYKFLRRYTLDTVRRVKEYQRLRRPDVTATMHHADARTVEFGNVVFDGVITSPPYPGRIDYHEQHRYAFELLGLDDRRPQEIGAAQKGLSRSTIDTYVDDMTAVFAHARRHTKPGGLFVIVIDDARDLYNEILAEAGLDIVERKKRHVNRRTGRRQGEFFEEIILARV
jgi:tRNA G10  N-methylase Trm11